MTAKILLIVCFVVSFSASAAAQALLVDSLGGVDVVMVDRPLPDARNQFYAQTLVLRTSDPSNRIVTFENVKIEGELLQVWLPDPFGGPTATIDDVGEPYPPEWVPYDSHLLMSFTQVGGGGFLGISETNDGSIVASPSLPPIDGFDPLIGFGSISMADPTHAFFLDLAFQSNEIELAQLVLPCDETSGGIFLTVGVLGEGIVNSGDPGGASFGFNGNGPLDISYLKPAACIPEPGSCVLFLVGILLAGRAIFYSARAACTSSHRFGRDSAAV